MAIFLIMSAIGGLLAAGEIRSPAASTASFIIIFGLLAGIGFVWHVLRPHRARRLLKYGTLVYGHITRFVPTGNYNNDRMGYKIEVLFNIENKQQTARYFQLLSCSHLGAANSLANSGEAVAIIYDKFSPNRIVLPEFLNFYN